MLQRTFPVFSFSLWRARDRCCFPGGGRILRADRRSKLQDEHLHLFRLCYLQVNGIMTENTACQGYPRLAEATPGSARPADRLQTQSRGILRSAV